MQRFSKGVKNTEIFQSEEKYKDFSKGRKNTEIFQRWSCCNGRLARVKNEKSFQSGEKYKDFSKR
jgi:hypothetical protein